MIFLNRIERLNKAVQETQSKLATLSTSISTTTSTSTSVASPSTEVFIFMMPQDFLRNQMEFMEVPMFLMIFVFLFQSIPADAQRIKEQLEDVKAVEESRNNEIKKLRQERNELRKEIESLNEKVWLRAIDAVLLINGLHNVID